MVVGNCSKVKDGIPMKFSMEFRDVEISRMFAISRP